MLVAVPPIGCIEWPSVACMWNSTFWSASNGIRPSRLEIRMKKNIVHRNGMKRSVSSPSSGLATSLRTYIMIASTKFRVPDGTCWPSR